MHVKVVVVIKSEKIARLTYVCKSQSLLMLKNSQVKMHVQVTVVVNVDKISLVNMRVKVTVVVNVDKISLDNMHVKVTVVVNVDKISLLTCV